MQRAVSERALDPVWFRFTDEEDRKKYGDRWYVYDESAILNLRARALIDLETDMDLKVLFVMNGFRDSTMIGDTGVIWMALRQADPTLAGDFEDFNPIIMSVEWRSTDPGPKDQAEPSESPQDPMPEPMDTVVLPTMPVTA